MSSTALLKRPFWRGRRVMVTGHTGFKGSWLSLWLTGMGAHVTGFALPPATEPNLFELARVGDRLAEHRVGDVRDFDALRRAMTETTPEVVIHMAAQALVGPSYNDPAGTFATNVLGTMNLLETVRSVAAPPHVVLCVTSDKCYRNDGRETGYVESDPMGAADPYSTSKAAAELMIECYRHSYFPPPAMDQHGIALASARAGNVIGGGDYVRGRIIPDLLAARRSGQHPVLRYPDATRPWQHVLDCLAGYIVLTERLWADPRQFAGAWNFGPLDHAPTTVRHIAEALCGPGGWDRLSTPTPPEAARLSLDAHKAYDRLGWAPMFTLDKALAAILSWETRIAQGADAQDVCLMDLNDYMIKF